MEIHSWNAKIKSPGSTPCSLTAWHILFFFLMQSTVNAVHTLEVAQLGVCVRHSRVISFGQTGPISKVPVIVYSAIYGRVVVGGESWVKHQQDFGWYGTDVYFLYPCAHAGVVISMSFYPVRLFPNYTLCFCNCMEDSSVHVTSLNFWQLEGVSYIRLCPLKALQFAD